MKRLPLLSILTLLFAQSALAQDNTAAPQSAYAIAYSGGSSGHRDIFITDAEGKSKLKITDFSGGNGYTAWSPDGKRIAFYAKYDDKKTWSIHTVNTDGTKRQRLTNLKNAWDNSPAWSPDGTQIVFARAYTDEAGERQYEIWTMNADGTGQQPIEGLHGGGPYFTPDGQIVFHSQPGPSEIFIANADGSNLRQLTQNEAEDWHPEVSPDGKQIAFMSDRDGNYEIYVMNLDGSDEKRITFSEGEKDWYPSWSPDGSELLVSSNNDKVRRVYRMNADGSHVRTVVENGSQAAWLKIPGGIASNNVNLTDPFLGQQRPGLTAIPFAHGIKPTEGWVLGGDFGPGSDEFYMENPNQGGYEAQVIVFRKEGREWKQHKFMQIHSTDSNKLYRRNQYIERTATGWSKMKSVGPMFEREDWGIMRVSASAKGTYVFDDYKSNDVIRISTIKDGVRQPPELLGPEINVGEWTAHPNIAPDESYLIWDSEREGGFGDSDIYVSFKQADGTWGKAVNLGSEVNSAQADFSSWITPDGKYLFFWRSAEKTRADGSTYTDSDKYWVSTEVIEKARAKHLSETLASMPNPIAYGSNGICLSSTDGSSKVRLTNGDHGYPAWSPDGKQLAYYGYYDGRKTWSIHTVNRDGTNNKRITHVKNKWDNMPTWSPDGSKIVFAREYAGEDGAWQHELWIMNADGTEERQLKALRGGGPCFLPDGRLLYHSEYSDKESEITIADLDGQNMIHLTDNEAEEWDAKVSPDGKEIAFTSNRAGNHDIYVMNIDGSGLKRLTDNDIDDYGPSWSPDGRQIVFQSKGPGADKDDPANLFIMNKDGSSVRKIVTTGWQPAWFNTGKQ